MIRGLHRRHMLCSWTFSQLTLRRRQTLLLFIFLSFSSLVAVFVKFHILCTVRDRRPLVQNVCTSYEDGEAVGSLCHSLCTTRTINHENLLCHSLDMSNKDPIFQGTWENISIIFKKAQKPPLKLYKLGQFKKKIYPSEDQFAHMLKSKIKMKFNLTVSPAYAKYIVSVKLPLTDIQMENIWTLSHSNEYLALVLYKNFNIFPKLIGTCGPLYGVEKLKSLSGYWHLVSLYDRHEEWMERVKVATLILDYLLHLERDLSEPFLICNMKLTDYGLTEDLKKVVYLDLDSVHPRSVASRMTSNGSHCRRHSDCDYRNCRSLCNLITYKCQHGVVNNNLQIVCEKIFLGWMSHRVMVPGLLIGPRTPRVLTEVLELCANPMGEAGTPRAPASDSIRKRLHDLLVHLTY